MDVSLTPTRSQFSKPHNTKKLKALKALRTQHKINMSSVATVNTSVDTMESTMEYCYGEVMRSIIYVVEQYGGEASFDTVASHFTSSPGYPEAGRTFCPREFLKYIVLNNSEIFGSFSVHYEEDVFSMY